MMDTINNYRYPGSRPFQDTDHDRRIFFGREQEAESLLHLILAENLVVLFAKSGMGKTSLLNAGVLQPLRDRGFLPLKIRFHDPHSDPLQSVYAAIEEPAALRNIEYHAGEQATLWHYFKSVEFWSTDDILLSPVLILDQFEEFFHLYLPEKRKAFITQFADLVKGRQPPAFQEDEPAYTDTPPNIKVIISIREDFIGQLEEMAREIPAILQNRFRILPLNRTQARQAIIEPAQLEDRQLNTKSFHYAPDALESMLGFLCKRRKRRETIISRSQKQSLIKNCLAYISGLFENILHYFYSRPRKYPMMETDEIEPFQLQLLCQHIEHIISEKLSGEESKLTVHKEDLGGEIGMQRVLQDFYDNQLKRLDSFRKAGKVRKLCEKGLISATDRRVSLEEEDIERRFKVSKPLLAELVNNRLLRVEPRVGSLYYELSHDTLVEPIRSSQDKRKIRRRKTAGIFMVSLILLVALYGYGWQRYYIYNWLGNAIRNQGKYQEAIKYYQKAIEFNSKYANAYYNLGNTFGSLGRYEKAIENLKKAIKLAPDEPNSYSNLGHVFFDQDNYEEAIVQYRQAIELAPDKAYYYNYLGTAFLEQGKYDEAVRQFNKAIELDPHDALYYSNLGYTFRRQTKYEEAATQYRKAIELVPDDSNSYNCLGNVFFDQGKYDEAITYYEKAIELAPDDSDFYNNLGNALFEQGKYDEAIPQYQKVVEFAPTDPNLYNQLGKVFFIQGKYDETIEQLRKAIKLAPNDALYQSYLGDVFTAQAKYEEAVEQYHKAIELAPDDAYYYKRLGNVFFDQGKYDEAVEQYNKAIELDPHNALYYNNLGYILRKQLKYEEAIEQYRKAIELAPDDLSFYNNLGHVFLDQGNYEEAIAQYQKAIELAPDEPLYYRNLANVLRRQAKYEEAIAQYQKAIELAPDESLYYRHLADVFRSQTKYEKAIAQYRRAIEIAPDDVYNYWDLADLLFGLKKYDESIEQFNKALKLTPTDANIYSALGEIFIAQAKYDEALVQYQKAIELVPSKNDFVYFEAKSHLAEIYLITERFDTVLALANEVIHEQEATVQAILRMKLLSTSALFFQGKQVEAIDALQDFIANYPALPEYYPQDLSYERSREFISNTQKLSETEKTLLLTLIDILETPKSQADGKLQALKTLLEQLKQEQ